MERRSTLAVEVAFRRSCWRRTDSRSWGWISPLPRSRKPKRRASGHPAGRRVRFIAGDVTEVRGIGEPFDVLVDRGCYHLARGDHLDAYLQALGRYSRSGSLLLVLAFSAAEQPEFPVPVVTEDELRNELGSLFEITDLRTCRLDKPHGFEREPLFWSVMLRRP